jgi:hypothetical protein
LELPQAPEGTNLEGQSWLLSAFSRFPDHSICGFGAPGLTKADQLRLFQEIDPKDGGVFTIEIGAILPDRFSSLSGQMDYALEVAESGDGDGLRVCISNQMCLLRYKLSNDDFGHALCPRFVLEKVMSDETYEVPDDAHVEYLSTLATCRFDIAGEDADDALELHIEDCLGKLMGAINRLVSAHLMLSDEHHPILSPVYDQNSFDHLYLLIEGRNADAIGVQRISPNAFRSALYVPEYDEEQSERFLAYASGAAEVDDVTRIMKTAKAYLDAGVVEFSLLQLAIAAEIATHRFVSRSLVSAGVSKGKLDSMQKEMTFSRALNIDVMALCPPGLKPNRGLLGDVDRVRRLRNGVMHEADLNATRDELLGLIGRTEEYVGHLNRVLDHKGLR